MSFLSKLKKIFSFEFFGKIVGSAPITTVLYIGYLPEWGRHWSAFASIIFSIILIYNTCGFEGSYIDMSYILMLQFIYGFFIANIMVPIFRKTHPFSKNENIVVDAFVAQSLLLSLTVPAIVYVNIGINSFASKMCSLFFNCPEFTTKFFIVFFTLLGPYFILRFFDLMEFWPTNRMFLYAELSINRIIAGIIPAIYAIVFIYIVAFLFFDLTLVSVIDFYGVIFSKTAIHLFLIYLVFKKIFTTKNLYILCKKIGIIKALDYYGLINAEHYDMKYLG